MSQTDSTVVATLDDDSKKLGFYDISDFQVIKARLVVAHWKPHVDIGAGP